MHDSPVTRFRPKSLRALAPFALVRCLNYTMAAAALGASLLGLSTDPATAQSSPSLTLSSRTLGPVPAGVSGSILTIACKNLLGGGSSTLSYSVTNGGVGVPTFWPLTGPTASPVNPGTSCIVSARPSGTANLTQGSVSLQIGGVDRPVTVTTVPANGSTPAAILATAQELPIFASTNIVVTLTYAENAGPVRYTALTPVRVIDSRNGTGVFAHQLVAGETLPVQIGRANGVADAATGALLNVTVTGTGGSGFVTVYPCDATRPNASNLNFTSGQTVPNLVSVRLSASGQACVYVSAPTFVIVDVNGYYASAGDGYESLPPNRILDTRTGNGAVNRLVAAGEVVVLQVTGRGGVATGSSSAVLNLTVTGPTGSGFVTVFPCDAARPNASNLNFVPGQTVANLVYARLDGFGRTCLYAAGQTHLIADVAGRFGAAAFHQPVTPVRIVDTRTGIGSVAAKVPAGAVLVVNMRGFNGVGTTAVAGVVNVTVTNPDDVGYLTVFPCDVALPNASNLNFSPNQSIANLVNVQLSGSGGQICVYTTARTDLIIDLYGYFLA